MAAFRIIQICLLAVLIQGGQGTTTPASATTTTVADSPTPNALPDSGGSGTTQTVTDASPTTAAPTAAASTTAAAPTTATQTTAAPTTAAPVITTTTLSATTTAAPALTTDAASAPMTTAAAAADPTATTTQPPQNQPEMPPFTPPGGTGGIPPFPPSNQPGLPTFPPQTPQNPFGNIFSLLALAGGEGGGLAQALLFSNALGGGGGFGQQQPGQQPGAGGPFGNIPPFALFNENLRNLYLANQFSTQFGGGLQGNLVANRFLDLPDFYLRASLFNNLQQQQPQPGFGQSPGQTGGLPQLPTGPAQQPQQQNPGPFGGISPFLLFGGEF